MIISILQATRPYILSVSQACLIASGSTATCPACASLPLRVFPHCGILFNSMRIYTGRIPSLLSISVFLLLCVTWHCAAYAAETSHAGRRALLEKFQRLEKKAPSSLHGISAYLDSFVEKKISGVDIYGVINYPFEFVEKEFMEHANWCNIVILHPNIKACTYLGTDKNRHLILFNADKSEQTLADASPIEFRWGITRQQGYVDILMRASEGPHSTSDHLFELEAAPRDEHRTVVHLRYSYGYGVLTSIFMKSYFAIFGGGKVGFSVTGTDSHDNPVYSSGLRGVNERNVARYYLAIIAYMETHHLQAEQRFEKSVSRWHDLASQYKRQLTPGEKKDYVARKKLDFKNQLQLQEAAVKPLN